MKWCDHFSYKKLTKFIKNDLGLYIETIYPVFHSLVYSMEIGVSCVRSVFVNLWCCFLALSLSRTERNLIVSVSVVGRGGMFWFWKRRRLVVSIFFSPLPGVTLKFKLKFINRFYVIKYNLILVKTVTHIPESRC